MRPARREADCAWELRSAWATLREVVVAWPGGRVRGYVEHVAPTDAFALVWDGCATIHVPLGLLPAVRRPHFHEPLDGVPVVPPAREHRPMPMAGQLAFAFDDPRLERHDRLEPVRLDARAGADDPGATRLRP